MHLSNQGQGQVSFLVFTLRRRRLYLGIQPALLGAVMDEIVAMAAIGWGGSPIAPGA